jgi:hypothetical protein
MDELGGKSFAMADAQSPATEALGTIGRRRVFCWLPLVTGAVVLVLCWIALAVALTVNGGSCFPEPGLEGIGKHLAFQYYVWDASGFGSGLALFIYAAICLAPYALLSGCVRLAARGRTTLFLAVLAITGTIFMVLYDGLGFWAAYDDLHRGVFLCGFAFDLLPAGGVVAGACAATAGSLAALLIEWRWRVRTQG